MYAYFGHHRSATLWTATIVRAISRELRLRVAQEDRYDILPSDLSQTDFLIHLNATDNLITQLAGTEYRAFHVIRDPRDILVSSYFSDKYSHPLHGQLGQFREQLVQAEFDEGLRLEMERRTAEFTALARWNYRNPRIYETRYEVLTTAPAEEFTKILTFLGIPMPAAGMANLSARVQVAANRVLHRVGLPLRATGIPPQWLAAFVSKQSFQRLSGRQKGNEDQKSHYRKGVAGDWENYLKDANRDLFKARWGGLLIDLGYEKDINW